MADEWYSYLQYLREWIDNHKETSFYGTSPACFDEWADNEYSQEE